MNGTEGRRLFVHIFNFNCETRKKAEEEEEEVEVFLILFMRFNCVLELLGLSHNCLLFSLNNGINYTNAIAFFGSNGGSEDA